MRSNPHLGPAGGFHVAKIIIIDALLNLFHGDCPAIATRHRQERLRIDIK